VDDDVCDLVIVNEEADPSLFSDGNEVGRNYKDHNTLKNQLTSGTVSLEEFVWDTKNGGKKRKRRMTEHQRIVCYAICSNAPGVESMAPALRSRFDQIATEINNSNSGRSVDALKRFLDSLSEDERKPFDDFFMECKEEQAFHWLVENLIYIGAIDPPLIDCTREGHDKMNAWLTSNNINPVEGRQNDRKCMFARRLAISHAYYRMYRCPGAKYAGKPLLPEDIVEEQEWLKDSEDIFCFVQGLCSGDVEQSLKRRVMKALCLMHEAAPNYLKRPANDPEVVHISPFHNKAISGLSGAEVAQALAEAELGNSSSSSRESPRPMDPGSVLDRARQKQRMQQQAAAQQSGNETTGRNGRFYQARGAGGGGGSGGPGIVMDPTYAFFTGPLKQIAAQIRERMKRSNDSKLGSIDQIVNVLGELIRDELPIHSRPYFVPPGAKFSFQDVINKCGQTARSAVLSVKSHHNLQALNGGGQGLAVHMNLLEIMVEDEELEKRGRQAVGLSVQAAVPTLLQSVLCWIRDRAARSVTANDDLVKRAMLECIEHKHTRKRRVVYGRAVSSEFPNLFQVVDLNPREKKVNFSVNAGYMCPASAIMLHGPRAKVSSKRSQHILPCNEDADSRVTRYRLEQCFWPLNEVVIKWFHPLEADARLLPLEIKMNGGHKGIRYPDDYMINIREKQKERQQLHQYYEGTSSSMDVPTLPENETQSSSSSSSARLAGGMTQAEIQKLLNSCSGTRLGEYNSENFSALLSCMQKKMEDACNAVKRANEPLLPDDDEYDDVDGSSDGGEEGGVSSQQSRRVYVTDESRKRRRISTADVAAVLRKQKRPVSTSSSEEQEGADEAEVEDEEEEENEEEEYESSSDGSTSSEDDEEYDDEEDSDDDSDVPRLTRRFLPSSSSSSSTTSKSNPPTLRRVGVATRTLRPTGVSLLSIQPNPASLRTR
jgi:hypothetical protein